MKLTDNYNAKLEIWARESKVHALPAFTGVPRFGAKKFSSYAELNAWKKGLLEQIAANGGVTWTPDFAAAEKRGVTHRTETGTPVRCLCGKDLLAGKEKTGRPQDQGDVEFLRKKAESGLL